MTPRSVQKRGRRPFTRRTERRWVAHCSTRARASGSSPTVRWPVLPRGTRRVPAAGSRSEGRSARASPTRSPARQRTTRIARLRALGSRAPAGGEQAADISTGQDLGRVGLPLVGRDRPASAVRLSGSHRHLKSVAFSRKRHSIGTIEARLEPPARPVRRSDTLCPVRGSLLSRTLRRRLLARARGALGNCARVGGPRCPGGSGPPRRRTTRGTSESGGLGALPRCVFLMFSRLGDGL